MLTMVAPGVVERIARAYNLPYAQFLQPQKGYRNQSSPVLLRDGTTVNLILYKREPGILARISAAHAVSDVLAAYGLPVRHAISSKIIRAQAGDHVRYGALYNYLGGHTIPWEAYTKDHIKQLGKTMSDMHGVLADAGTLGLSEVAAEYRVILGRMHAYFTQQPVGDALRSKLQLAVSPHIFEEFERTLKAATKLPAQPLHMDFVRSNILFAGVPDSADLRVRVSGILDFEKAASGSPLFDIARTLAFLLVDCKYKTPAQVRKYFLRSGYQKRGAANLDARHLPLLEPLVNLFLFYDFYKFLRHNPYEHLPENEHFTRTRELLLQHRLVLPTTP